MFLTRKRRFIKKISLVILKLSLMTLMIVFVIIPLLFKYSIRVQRGMLFLTFVKNPKNVDLNYPSRIGLYGTRNFYVTYRDSDIDEDINIGVWHILPLHIVKRYTKELQLNDNFINDVNNITIDSPLIDKNVNEYLDKVEDIIKSDFPLVTSDNELLFYERMLRQPGIIVIYLHGNTGSRAASHRVEMSKVLRKIGCHVIVLDYRGYADSSYVTPTEEGVVKDSLNVYNYIKNLTNNPIFLWGHSLGTGVSTHLLSLLSQINEIGPKGVVLESPFTNIREELLQYPYSKIFKNLPWFDYTISKPLYSNSLRFESDKHISKFRQPILILHAEDDNVVPFELGYKLYRVALDTRGQSWGPVEFHRFVKSLNYGHLNIYKSPDLPDIVKSFFDRYRNENY